MKEKKTTTYATAAKPIPDGFHTVTPFVIVDDANQLLNFIKKAFQGETTFIMNDPDGKVMHATAKIGDSIVMVADVMERFPAMPCMLYLYVDDVDTVYQKALKAGGQSLREPTNEFYGDRSAGIKDTWGNQWWIATHIEDVDEEEMERRAKEFRKQ
jgi:PhnB protein